MWNVKLRLYLIVIFTTLPLIVYIGFSYFQKIQIQRTNLLDHLTEITNLAAAEHKQINEGARQLLLAISANSAILINNQADCNKYLSDLKNNYVRYLNFGVIDRTGRVLCAADLRHAIDNPPNDALIKDTLSTQSFTLGSYYPVKPRGSVINFGYPINTNLLIYASLSLEWVSEFVNNFNTSGSNFVVNILDKDGTVLARSPSSDQAVGQNFATDPLVEEIIEIGQGQTTKLGIDKVSRLYAFTSLDDTHTTFIAVGISEDEIYASLSQSLITDAIIIVGIIMLSLLLTQKVGQILILKQIESLQAIDKLKDEFVSLASHQIRSPLTAIRWLSETLLESRPSLRAKQRGSLVKIYQTTLRLITLTSNLLSISRLESGALTPHPQTVKLHQMMDPIVKEFASLTLVASNPIKTSIPKSLSLKTDPELLCEVLKVLLGNAIKYSTPKHSIYLSAKSIKHTVTIQVKNTGIPIPHSFRSHIFTRFSRADNASAHAPDGNGLGLYLAKLIIIKLNGTLSYTSQGSVTIFTLTLPNEVK